MVTQYQTDSLKLEHIRQEFEEVGECIEEDLSCVKVTLTRDVHTDSYDLEICIYGQEYDRDDAPIIQNIYNGESNVFDTEMLKTKGAVAPYRVLALFDQRLLDMFISAGIKIYWNEDDVSHKMINPIPRLNAGLLFAQDR